MLQPWVAQATYFGAKLSNSTFGRMAVTANELFGLCKVCESQASQGPHSSNLGVLEPPELCQPNHRSKPNCTVFA